MATTTVRATAFGQAQTFYVDLRFDYTPPPEDFLPQTAGRNLQFGAPGYGATCTGALDTPITVTVTAISIRPNHDSLAYMERALSGGGFTGSQGQVAVGWTRTFTDRGPYDGQSGHFLARELARTNDDSTALRFEFELAWGGEPVAAEPASTSVAGPVARISSSAGTGSVSTLDGGTTERRRWNHRGVVQLPTPVDLIMTPIAGLTLIQSGSGNTATIGHSIAPDTILNRYSTWTGIGGTPYFRTTSGDLNTTFSYGSGGGVSQYSYTGTAPDGWVYVGGLHDEFVRFDSTHGANHSHTFGYSGDLWLSTPDTITGGRWLADGEPYVKTFESATVSDDQQTFTMDQPTWGRPSFTVTSVKASTDRQVVDITVRRTNGSAPTVALREYYAHPLYVEDTTATVDGRLPEVTVDRLARYHSPTRHGAVGAGNGTYTLTITAPYPRLVYGFALWDLQNTQIYGAYALAEPLPAARTVQRVRTRFTYGRA